MIVSHRHRCIYIDLPIAGSEQLLGILHSLLESRDAIDTSRNDTGSPEHHALDLSSLPRHATAAEIKALLDQDTWKDYFKFAFVRNPWEMLVASFTSPGSSPSAAGGEITEKNLDRVEFEDYLLSLDWPMGRYGDFLCDSSGKLLVDYVGKFEDLDRDLEQVAGRLGVQGPKIETTHWARIENYADYYNALTRDLVQSDFRADLERFGYHFEAKGAGVGSATNRFRPPPYLIAHFSHHKAGTLWFQRVLKKLAERLGWRFQSCFETELNADTAIFMQENSRVDLSRLADYRGSHIVRDPRDMVVSGYFYHLWCEEPWCLEAKARFEGKSYQAMLNSLSREQGIELEIDNCRSTFKRMSEWNYQDPNLIEVRFEDMLEDQYAVFRAVFEKYGLSSSQIEIGMSVVEQCDFARVTGRRKGEESEQSHLRKGVSGDWKNHFTAAHVDKFKHCYPGLLSRLGYEDDDSW